MSAQSWPLPLSRSHYEYQALVHQARLAPGLVPGILHHNEALAVTAMELLELGIIMLELTDFRDALPAFRRSHHDISGAHTVLQLRSRDRRRAEKDYIADFAGNHALCKITEDLIFTDPYLQAEQNRWTSPCLDAIAADFRDDLDLHVAISRLKLKFMTCPEALIHGDLHTGSIMVTESDTRVIDPEFAFYGPMGFDLGAVLGNLLMIYLATVGHERTAGERRAFETWVLETTEASGIGLRSNSSRFGAPEGGDAFPPALFAGGRRSAARAERQPYMERLFQDTVGFAAAKIIRRILGLAHSIVFEWIEDPEPGRPARRAACVSPARCCWTPRRSARSARSPRSAAIALLAARFRWMTAIRFDDLSTALAAIAAHRR